MWEPRMFVNKDWLLRFRAVDVVDGVIARQMEEGVPSLETMKVICGTLNRQHYGKVQEEAPRFLFTVAEEGLSVSVYDSKNDCFLKNNSKTVPVGGKHYFGITQMDPLCLAIGKAKKEDPAPKTWEVTHMHGLYLVKNSSTGRVAFGSYSFEECMRVRDHLEPIHVMTDVLMLVPRPHASDDIDSVAVTEL